ncbi:MAG: glycosyltransferase [Chloroflexi bacterium]|nr:glycosyltransferase [Chloroflexota bacterium]
MPTISVVIPTYNRAKYLVQAVESVLGQTFRDFELIVVDDGSTDDTAHVLAPYADRLSYVYQRNRREGAARNTGIRLARGDYVAFLDSDDLWLPGKLAQDLAAFQAAPDSGLVYSAAEFVADDGSVLRRRLPHPEGDVFARLALENFIPLSTATVRRACLREAGGFREDPDLSGTYDWELWVRLAARYRFAYGPRVATHIRAHAGNMLSDASHMERAMLRGVELVLANPTLGERVAGRQARIRASMYYHIGVNHYSNGHMARARHYFAKAARTWPQDALTPRLAIAWAKTLVGARGALALRRARRILDFGFWILD